MITKKLIDEHFHNYPYSIGQEKFIQLYSKTEPGTYVQHKYMGYVSLKNGKAVHHFSGRSTKDMEELLRITKEWADSTPFTSDTYSIDFVPGHKEVLQVTEYLKKLGFDYDNDNTYHSNLSLKLSSLYKNSNFISVKVNRNDDYKDENDHLINIIFEIGNDSWVPVKSKSTEDAIVAINSYLTPVVTEVMTKASSIFIHMNDSKIENSKYQELAINTIDMGTLSINKTSLKETMIEMLEKQLEQLKSL